VHRRHVGGAVGGVVYLAIIRGPVCQSLGILARSPQSRDRLVCRGAVFRKKKRVLEEGTCIFRKPDWLLVFFLNK
jgi:hypothetical protein